MAASDSPKCVVISREQRHADVVVSAVEKNWTSAARNQFFSSFRFPFSVSFRSQRFNSLEISIDLYDGRTHSDASHGQPIFHGRNGYRCVGRRGDAGSTSERSGVDAPPQTFYDNVGGDEQRFELLMGITMAEHARKTNPTPQRVHVGEETSGRTDVSSRVRPRPGTRTSHHMARRSSVHGRTRSRATNVRFE